MDAQQGGAWPQNGAGCGHSWKWRLLRQEPLRGDSMWGSVILNEPRMKIDVSKLGGDKMSDVIYSVIGLQGLKVFLSTVTTLVSG